MTLPIVLGDRAEASCRLLHQTRGLHRLQSTVVSSEIGDRDRLSPPTFDGVQVQRQATLLRMISITEAFCVDRLLDVAENDVDTAGSPVRAAVWEKASASAVGSWQAIEGSYQSWYNVQPGWTKIRQLTEVRNAIAHGLGNLTRLQRSKRDSAAGKIVEAGVRLDGDRVVLEDRNLDAALFACADLISNLDRLVQNVTGDSR